MPTARLRLRYRIKSQKNLNSFSHRFLNEHQYFFSQYFIESELATLEECPTFAKVSYVSKKFRHN